MRKRELTIGLTLVALMIGAAFILFSGKTKAPIVTLTDIDSNTINIPSDKKYSLVTFWATTCTGCQAEVPHLIDLQTKYSESNLNITAVAMFYDPEEQVHIFREARALNYPIVLDKDGSIAKQFGNVALTPTTFLIDKEGTILYKKVGQFDDDHIQSILTGG